MGIKKTFNVYCDESCHLENDHKTHLILGKVSCAYPQVQLHTEAIKALKIKHNYTVEIKWTKVSHAKIEFYRDLIDYFFSNDLQFRAVVVKKDQINNINHDQTWDEFYYKMYYYLLNHNIDPMNKYNVYLDIKDDLSALKVRKLKDILNIRYGVFRNVQNIRSHESILLQLADFIIGAISYNVNESKQTEAKQSLIQRIEKKSGQKLDCSTSIGEDKLNLFFINLA